MVEDIVNRLLFQRQICSIVNSNLGSTTFLGQRSLLHKHEMQVENEQGETKDNPTFILTRREFIDVSIKHFSASFRHIITFNPKNLYMKTSSEVIQ